MKNSLFSVLICVFALYAQSNTTYVTPINEIDGIDRHKWVKIEGRVLSNANGDLKVHDKSGTIYCTFLWDDMPPEVHRNDTITLTGIVYRPLKHAAIVRHTRPNPKSTLKIQHIEKGGKTVYANITRPDFSLPVEYEQNSLNQVIYSERQRLRKRAIIFSSASVAVQLLPALALVGLVADDGDNGAIYMILAMGLETAIQPISISLGVAGIRNIRRVRRMPLMSPRRELEYKEVELDLSLQLKPVEYGGGLFLVGSF